MAPNETWRMWRGVSTVRYNFQLVYIFLLKHVETTENSDVSDRPRFGCQKHPGGPCFCCIWSWVCLKMGDALPQKMAGISWWFLLFPFVDQNCYWKLVRFPVSHSIPVVLPVDFSGLLTIPPFLGPIVLVLQLGGTECELHPSHWAEAMRVMAGQNALCSFFFSPHSSNICVNMADRDFTGYKSWAQGSWKEV